MDDRQTEVSVFRGGRGSTWYVNEHSAGGPGSSWMGGWLVDGFTEECTGECLGEWISRKEDRYLGVHS